MIDGFYYLLQRFFLKILGLKVYFQCVFKIILDTKSAVFNQIHLLFTNEFNQMHHLYNVKYRQYFL